MRYSIYENDRNGVQHLWQDEKNKGNEKGQAIAKLIMEQYQPQNKDEMQEAIKDVFGPMLEAMLQDKMDNHLGYISFVVSILYKIS